MYRLLTLLALASAAVAQGVVPLSGTVRFGSLGAGFAGPCGPNPTPTVFGDEGTLTFTPNGRFGLSVTTYAVCPGGTASMSPVQTGTGSYDVRTDGTVVLEWVPALPGADPDWLFLRTDGGVVVRTRHSEHSDESVLLVGAALSSGKTAASLAGSWHLVRFSQRNPSAGMAVVADAGTIDFDGVGGYRHSGTRRTLPFGGSVTTASYGPNNGTYSVAPDGTVTTGIGATGAVAPAGDVFFWILRSGTEISMTVGLRKGSARSAPMVAGDWWIALMNHGIQATASPVSLRTDLGTLALQPATSTAGTFDLTMLHVESTLAGTQLSQSSHSDAFDVSPDGVLNLTSGGQIVVAGAVNEHCDTFLGVVDPGDGLGVAVGLSAGRWPHPVGSPTSGAGGIAPQLLPVGGFPRAGNAGFGLVVAGGLGGAPAALLLAADTAPGLPFLGGTLWVDPGKLLVAVPLQLSGPTGWTGAGAAGLPLSIPADPLLAGARIVAQALVVDAGAPQGVAMSAGLDVELCR
ncbi:MAG: hypothetical protein IPM29_16950 [Planctomycetes bacterium]|nr:hypothetical protein [Planctomycetota bacterium]